MDVQLKEIEEILEEVNPKSKKQKVLSENDDLFKEGRLDSMSVVQFILAIEKKYTIKIGKKDISLQTFSSLKNIRELIQSKKL